MATNKFIITRKDLDIDPVVVESEGLTIGRLTGNDLVLNHPTVSRTHAGIKEVNGDYCIFNLSEANGTLLNGELVDNTPLADGDLIQIGPFFLQPTYTPDGLALSVEMSVKPLPVEASGTTTLAPLGEAGKTLLLKVPQGQREKPTPQGTRRLSPMSGTFTSLLSKPDEQALKIFWDARKREAGKKAEDSPLKPKGGRRLGKAQFNWLPTRDLQRSWPVGVFGWGAIVITLLSVAAAFAFKDAYSPGVISSAHARNNLLLTPAIARQPNAGSCTTCHAVKGSMQEGCASCHTTSAFNSSVSKEHMAVGLTCRACHSEHRGRSFSPAFMANTGCTSCHREGVVSHGKQLHTPHGGKVGYPTVIDGKWLNAGFTMTPEAWKSKGLPGTFTDYDPKYQFHLIHLAGSQQGRARCSDCHQVGFEGEDVRKEVRESCIDCHDINYQAASKKKARERNVETGCVGCHAQHGEEKELKASIRRMVASEAAR